MFNNIFQQGEILYNDELKKIYKALKYIIDSAEPLDGSEKSLWLNNDGEMNYYENGKWKLLFGERFKITESLMNYTEPSNPIEGQLWIKAGTLMYYNGFKWDPVKAQIDTLLTNENIFQNFLLINGLGEVKNANSNITEKIIDFFDFKTILPSDIKLLNYELSEIISHEKIFVDVFKDGALLTKDIDYALSIVDNSTKTVINLTQLGKEWLRGAIFDVKVKIKNISANEIQNDGKYFMVPSINEDRIFFNRLHQYPTSNAYEPLSNVCIHINNDVLQDKLISAVHVNPRKIISIEKNIIFPRIINNSYRLEISDENTELYAFSGGTGRLLVKKEDYMADDMEWDYTSSSSGIILNNTVMNNNATDFIVAIRYIFSEKNSSGALYKRKITADGNTSIFVGNVKESLAVLCQGFCLGNSADDYIYDKNSGYVVIKNMPSKLNVAILEFDKRCCGKIIPSGNTVVVHLDKMFACPIIFAGHSTQNYNINKLLTADSYEYDRLNNSITIRNVTAGKEYMYSVVESYTGPTLTDEEMKNQGTINNISNEYKMIKYIGTAATDGFITVPNMNFTTVPSGEELIFVNGIYVSTRDIKRTGSNTIEIKGIKTGQNYVILRDQDNNRLLFDDEVNKTTVGGFPTKISTALLYVENMLVLDNNSIMCELLDEKDTDNYAIGQVKLMTDPITKTENFYIVNVVDTVKKWEKVVDQNKITKLNSSINKYMTTDRCVNILQEYDDECFCYVYKYANTVDRPIYYSSSIRTLPDDKNFIPFIYKHQYVFTKDINSCSVWINGIRQSTIEEVLHDKDYGFVIDGPLKNPIGNTDFLVNVAYTIEQKPNGALKCSDRAVLNNSDSISPRVYDISKRYNFSMANGYIRVYVGGYRQKKSAYNIIGSSLISFENSVNNYNNNKVISDVKYKNDEEILVEVVYDYEIKEQTIIYNDNRILDNYNLTIKQKDYGLEDSLLESGDKILVFINGQLFQGECLIDNKNKTVRLVDTLNQSIKNASITTFNGNNYDYEITFEWR